MRIVGGKYRGTRLITPKDDQIRPTSDRVRESLFNILNHMPDFNFDGIHVFDPFCGTGALGLEALSRGAQSCIFSDSSKTSMDLVRRNAERFQIDKNINFINAPAVKASTHDRITDNSLSLVFLDPPYGKNLAAPVANTLQKSNKLKDGCLIVVEMAIKSMEPAPSEEFLLKQTRTYGITVIHIYQYR